MSAKRVQWLAAFLTLVGGAVLLYAQNPVSISQVGTTPVTTTVPVSGTVTANMGTVTADPFGANADAASATGSISAKLRFIAGTGIPITGTVTVGSHAVTNAGTFVTQENGAALTALQLIDNAVSGNGYNITQLNGVNITMGNGVAGTGVQRVTLASDSTGQVTIATGANTIGALTANQSVNVAQINGVTPLMGAGNTGTGSHRVTIATDQAALAGMGVGATGAAPPANANYLGGLGSGATGGFTQPVTSCDSQAFLDMTTATTTELVALTSGRKVYVCYWLAMANGTTVMTFKRGTGTNCGTGTTSISPAWDLAAQTGFSGGGGLGAVFDNQTAANALCVTSSAAVNLHVFVRYAIY